MKKKELSFKKFLKILETNSRDNPLDITRYTISSLIENRKKIKSHSNFIIKFYCKDCKRLVIKNIHRWTVNNKLMMTYCGPCLLKHNFEKKYGVTNPNKLVEIRDKIGKTNIKKYGVENPGQRDCQKEAISKANIENAKTRLEKSRKTNLKNRGVEYPSQSKEVKRKIKKSVKKNWGVDCILQSKEIKKRIKETNLEKYGVEYPMQSKDIRSKTKKKFEYNNQYFDSYWELAFYIYHLDKGHKIIREPCSFEYTVGDKVHKYFPDFKVENRYYEIKGEQYIQRDESGNISNLSYYGKTNKKLTAKYECMKLHRVIIIDFKKIKKYISYINNKKEEELYDRVE